MARAQADALPDVGLRQHFNVLLENLAVVRSRKAQRLPDALAANAVGDGRTEPLTGAKSLAPYRERSGRQSHGSSKNVRGRSVRDTAICTKPPRMVYGD